MADLMIEVNIVKPGAIEIERLVQPFPVLRAQIYARRLDLVVPLRNALRLVSSCLSAAWRFCGLTVQFLTTSSRLCRFSAYIFVPSPAHVIAIRAITLHLATLVCS